MNLNDAVYYVLETLKPSTPEEAQSLVLEHFGSRIHQAYLDLVQNPELTESQLEQLSRIRSDIVIPRSIWENRGLDVRLNLTFWNGLGPESEDKRDTHTEHCCLECGCKFGDPKCSVVNEVLRQTSTCYRCNDYDQLDFAFNEEFPSVWHCHRCPSRTYRVLTPAIKGRFDEGYTKTLTAREVCHECGDFTMSAEEAQLLEFEEGLFCLKKGLRSGKLFHFCRKVAGLTKFDLAESFVVPVDTIRDWEQVVDAECPAMAALALRTLLSDAFEEFKATTEIPKSWWA